MPLHFWISAPTPLSVPLWAGGVACRQLQRLLVHTSATRSLPPCLCSAVPGLVMPAFFPSVRSECLDPTGAPPPGRRQVALAAGLVCWCLVPTGVGALRAGLMAWGSLSPHPQCRPAPEKVRGLFGLCECIEPSSYQLQKPQQSPCPRPHAPRSPAGPWGHPCPVLL